VLDQVTERLKPVVPRFLKAEAAAEPVKRKAGRPLGSKNKVKKRSLQKRVA
jgi:hypothetical protein